MGQMFFKLFLIPSYFSLPPLLSYCLWAFLPFPSHLLPVLLSFSQFWFLLTLLSTSRHIFFSFWVFPPPPSPLYQPTVSSEHLLAPCVFCRHECYMTGHLHSFDWVYCQQAWQMGGGCVWEHLLSRFWLLPHQSTLRCSHMKGITTSKFVENHAIVTLRGCPSSEAAANLPWAEKWIFLSLSLFSNSL